ncbi:NLP/P60 protein [Thalassoporum mexicanum PCC 7367]|uniref:C40 family peptidase n=1 Tax=Thalassoporum mexicanum TaxID=3457544 RepID=UPI00029FC0F7|nr:C40 family peptidase [Pseudanabaena sp. PCC 7367]AFY70085.1 NLP/P60 protein [Pseudanabaena sp. PCC 7367]
MLNYDRLYHSNQNINLYSSPDLQELVTQVAGGLCLQVLSDLPDPLADIQKPIQVQLLADAYVGYLNPIDRHKLIAIASEDLDAYRPLALTRSEIESRIDQAIAFAKVAMACPNEYLWGGTVAPNYDCSGLVQAAFGSVGVQLPRDSYQQEAFLEPIEIAKLEPGDLIFFGSTTKTNHVAIYLGAGQYIHSSGKDSGRNGIAIDCLAGGDPIASKYAAQIRGAGRINHCYQGVWQAAAF